jgi:hypothetical protein
MNNKDYTIAFTVDQSPEEAFEAINNPSAWWTGEFKGSSDKLGAEFTYEYKPYHFSKQTVTEFIPGKKVVWSVSESNLSFLKDTSEWDGTKIEFDITKKSGKTEVRFTHDGLYPEIECYDACSNAWGSLIGKSLRSLIETGVVEETTF